MAIEKEAKREGDLVQGDFKDTYHHLAYKRIPDEAVLVSNCLSLTFFHELSTKNFCVATILDKDAI